MSVVMARILGALVAELQRRGLLELADGVAPAVVAEEVVAHMARAPQFSQAGGFIADALVRSPHVVELYASNREILAVMRELDP